jgi:hypothetical protein
MSGPPQPAALVVRFEYEEAEMESGWANGGVGLAEQQLVGASVHADDVIAKQACHGVRGVSACSVVEEDGVQISVVALFWRDAADAEKAEALGRRVARQSDPWFF